MHSEPDGSRAARKDEHVDLALQQRGATPRGNEFDDVEFVHHALDGVDAERVDLGVTIAAGAQTWEWPLPFYVNGMTGGTERTTRLNREIAIAARETGVPMACGSVSVALDDDTTAAGFAVIREENPNGFVMANVGVGRPADDAKRAVALLEADALQVHVNALQETAMPEGSCDFSSWLHSVEALTAAAPVPVIVKEVGFGLSTRTLRQLHDMGVTVADVSGKGGTDFLAIENARRPNSDFAMLTGFGQSAAACLIEADAAAATGVQLPTLLASGGVRTPLDVVKALALGAQAVGVAGTFLAAVDAGGAAQLISLISDWSVRTRAVYALLGATSRDALRTTDVVLREPLRAFSEVRGADTVRLASRSSARPLFPQSPTGRMQS